MSQLALPLQLADHAVFDSFLSQGNEALVATLKDLAASRATPGCWIAGPEAAGKTHLLQAVCDRAGDRSVYIPLGLMAAADTAMLDGLASRELVCLDDLDAVCGEPRWEQALFVLCNQILEADGGLVIASTGTPRAAGIELPDLQSRLARLPTFQLKPLAESARASALQLRARHRGLDLPDETARYLLTRSRRDMTSLYQLLDRLDSEALRAQRRLTIPFVRDILAQARAG
jgi:DnaA family protein